MATPTISTQRLTLLPTPFDAKRCNYYVDGSNIVIETIAEYLVRVSSTIRDTNPITMLTPKTGYVSLGTYPLANFDSILANFDTRLYSFEGGVADGDLKEMWVSYLYNYPSLKIGTATNYTEFETDGTIIFHGNATVFDDLRADAITIQQTGPGVSINASESTVEYITTSDLSDYIFTNPQMSHQWKLGSVIYPHLHFFQTSAAIPNFLIRYRWQIDGGAKITAWSEYKCNTTAFSYTSGTINQICHGVGIIPPVGAGLSDIIQIRLFRDNANTSGVFTGSDPLAATVGVLALDIHYEKDTLGSHSEFTK